MIVSGGKIIDQCWYCGKYVTLNNWRGGLHVCLTEEERETKNAQSQLHMNIQQRQLSPVSPDNQALLKQWNAPKRALSEESNDE